MIKIQLLGLILRIFRLDKNNIENIIVAGIYDRGDNYNKGLCNHVNNGHIGNKIDVL